MYFVDIVSIKLLVFLSCNNFYFFYVFFRIDREKVPNETEKKQNETKKRGRKGTESDR